MKKLILILIIAITPIALNSQITSYDELVKLSSNPSQLEVKKGENFYILLNYDLAKGWKTYTFESQINDEGIGPLETELNILDTNLAVITGKPFHKAPTNKFDEGFEMKLNYFKGNFDVIIPAKANSDLDFNNDKVELEVYLMICDSTKCLPPEPMVTVIGNQTFNPNDFEFFNNNDLEKDSEKVFKTESQSEIDKKKKEGVWSFLWFAMLAGAGALVTPCVFPMIPITVSFFTKRAEKSQAKGLRDSIVYALGIILTFTGIGIILAAILGPTGIRDFAADAFVNIIIAAIFIIFALNLFGAFEIQIPTSIMNKLNKQTQGTGIGSILAMGLVFSLTSFTCTVPFVGSALISATGGEWFYPIIGMLGFSAVFAAPFFLLALFPSAMNKLPKAGGWMNNVKVVMGFLEIAAAIKFLSNADLVWQWGLLSRDAFLSIWIICGLLIVVYILGVFKLKMDSDISHMSSLRVIWAIIFGSIAIYLIPGIFGKSLGELDAFLPPKDYMNNSSSSSGLLLDKNNLEQSTDKWYKDYDKAMEIAAKEGKNVFIDFTGWTCTNCRWMESNMFPKQDVSGLLSNYIKVKLYTDRRKEPELSYKKMQKDRFNSIELPLYVIQTASESVIGTKTFTRDKAEFKDFLEKGLN